MSSINWKSIFSFKPIAFTLAGVLSAVVALKGFMMPNHFLDGGVTGISILAHEATHYNISWFLVGLNIPFVIVGYKKMGKTFALHSLLAVLLLAFAMNYIEIGTVTDDKLLIAVFGGLLIGLGIGLVIRGGAVIDGFEIVAHYTQKKSAFSSSEIILVVNTSIFLLAAFIVGIEAAMYSILTYFTAGKTVDYVVDGFEEYTALTIISNEYEQVKSIISNDLGKPITVYKGERGYLPESFQLHSDCDIVMTIVTRLEIHYIKQKLNKVDPNAFFFIQRIKEVKGGEDAMQH